MYVHFGFQLARLCRARTIDLQCQSLSLSVELFATQRVCVGQPNRRGCCRSLASSPAESIENHRENPSKIDAGDTAGHPKSMQIRSWDPLGTLRGAQERPEGVPGVSRERLGAYPARPGRAPESVRERAEATKIDAKSRPGVNKIKFLSQGSFANPDRYMFVRRFLSIFGLIFVVLCSQFARASRLVARRAKP